MKECILCKVPLKGRQLKYCSSKCQKEFEYLCYIERWQQGLENGMRGKYLLSNHVRKYLLKKYNYRCSKCGWGEINPFTGTCPLEVDHIDGDFTNNKEENLRILCPNCHSLTSTYKGANKGKGRRERTKYA